MAAVAIFTNTNGDNNHIVAICDGKVFLRSTIEEDATATADKIGDRLQASGYKVTYTELTNEEIEDL